MIEFVVMSTYCILIQTFVDFSQFHTFESENRTFSAANCTLWSLAAARSIGYRYGAREWNGWLINSGDALPEEIAPMDELKKVKAGWMVDFVNNNEWNGRHAVTVVEVTKVGSTYIDVIGVGFNGKRNEINKKIYRLASRDHPQYSDDMYATMDVPVIATYQPKLIAPQPQGTMVP